jgi:hypothetical protein
MGRFVAFVLIVGTVAAAYAGWIYKTRMATAPTQPGSFQPPLRFVEAEGSSAACAAGETLVSAICYSGPGSSISASGPALREGERGVITATCLTGGRKLRLTCLAKQ